MYKSTNSCSSQHVAVKPGVWLSKSKQRIKNPRKLDVKITRNVFKQKYNRRNINQQSILSFAKSRQGKLTSHEDLYSESEDKENAVTSQTHFDTRPMKEVNVQVEHSQCLDVPSKPSKLSNSPKNSNKLSFDNEVNESSGQLNLPEHPTQYSLNAVISEKQTHSNTKPIKEVNVQVKHSQCLDFPSKPSQSSNSSKNSSKLSFDSTCNESSGQINLPENSTQYEKIDILNDTLDWISFKPLQTSTQISGNSQMIMNNSFHDSSECTPNVVRPDITILDDHTVSQQAYSSPLQPSTQIPLNSQRSDEPKGVSVSDFNDYQPQSPHLYDLSVRFTQDSQGNQIFSRLSPKKQNLIP
uniref:uncharacterized protein LOC120341976 isoform X2 n=1 Tax=Styela clava TaxID=7725 RepID=UPI001939E3E7|nr:uncharacterized protein LOC120341976 isoform X2 [Styela clava]